MNKRTTGIALIAGALITAMATAQLNNLQIQDDTAGSEEAAAAQAQPQEQQQKFILVSTLNTREANREFDQNVRLVQLQRQRAIELNNAIQTAQTDAARDGLQKELDQVMAKLNENNQKMLQAYGFTLTRSYTRVIETSSIFMQVSDEEAKQFEEDRRRQNEESNN